jgi:hypothetical protein
MGKVVLRDGDTVYTQEAGSPTPAAWVRVYGINWLDLSRQKHRLLHLIWEDKDDILWGLVSLIDAIQDQAEADGHPVVFFSDEEEEE